MNWKEWKKYYQMIVKRLGIDNEKDKFSAHILNKIIKNRIDKEKIEYKLKKLLNNSNIFIFGCGPSLDSTIKLLKAIDYDGINIAADGAITALLENEIFCHINVSDLDGNINDSLDANLKGTITIIHAHGDNINLIRDYVEKFRGNILGSVQTEPFGSLINYGGFTDGDRCVFLATKFNCKRIILVGFDFGKKVGKYSKQNLGKHIAGPEKLIKLEFASFLISEILKKYDIEMFTLSKDYNIDGLISISLDELKEILREEKE
ncbi:MAG: DUF115 domain-containing protein [Promethearchaeota archaeon]|nr:MAG: DUF115 domain-containing protein [Candidatus Lokiarchaeota archaeon]